MSSALSICVLFYSLMQLVNEVQFLIIKHFLIVGATGVPVFEIFIAPLTSMYASLYSHKLDFSIEVLNLI